VREHKAGNALVVVDNQNLDNLPHCYLPPYTLIPSYLSAMPIEIITKADLEEFRLKLLEDIKLIGGQPAEPKKWLKSYQVRNLLKISPGTLQTLRVNGALPYTKVGGIMYYKYDDIQKLLEGPKKK
jgi:hypothetical protein